MVPLYSARISDLTHAETITARCPACGHTGEVSVETLWRRLPSWFKVLDLGDKLRCTGCRARHVEVKARRTRL